MRFPNYTTPALHHMDWYNPTNLAAVSFDSTAVVNLLATANATSEIKGGELPY